MSILLLIVLLLLIFGGGFGFYSGYWGPGGGYNPIGIVLVIIVLFLVFGLLGFGPSWHHAYW